eukprot:scaffold7077_cov299-Pinguiococcus_pyrenoidosus.AAC.1
MVGRYPAVSCPSTRKIPFNFSVSILCQWALVDQRKGEYTDAACVQETSWAFHPVRTQTQSLHYNFAWSTTQLGRSTLSFLSSTQYFDASESEGSIFKMTLTTSITGRSVPSDNRKRVLLALVCIAGRPKCLQNVCDGALF